MLWISFHFFFISALFILFAITNECFLFVFSNPVNFQQFFFSYYELLNFCSSIFCNKFIDMFISKPVCCSFLLLITHCFWYFKTFFIINLFFLIVWLSLFFSCLWFYLWIHFGRQFIILFPYIDHPVYTVLITKFKKV